MSDERKSTGAAGGAGLAQEGAGQEGQVVRSESEWRQLLTPAQYHVLRERGTEPPFSAPAEVAEVPGEAGAAGSGHGGAGHAGAGHAGETRIYQCAGCGAELFDGSAKYNSGSGWPSFFRPLKDGRIATQADVSHGMVRTEIHCARCGGHLGHVFPDGPRPTGQRYCVNGLSLKVKKSP